MSQTEHDMRSYPLLKLGALGALLPCGICATVGMEPYLSSRNPTAPSPHSKKSRTAKAPVGQQA